MRDTTHELTLDEASNIVGMPVSVFMSATGQLPDGRIVRRTAAQDDSGHYALAVDLFSADGAQKLDTRLLRWEDSADGQYLELVAAEATSEVPGDATHFSTDSYTSTTSSPCPIGTIPKGTCVKVSKDFLTCCAACIWAGPTAILCGLTWCPICLAAHCEKTGVICVNYV
ncbi:MULTISPECIES: hypothetical protein [unclassified Actinomyces]|uniref:hypothetical protein n=1 Tax=unclassified Actinomyces TaxID=2609248 RepID=UPI002016B6A0|nr:MULTISPECIES: hypothetical protein [unclassified Actinomyces]MCL3777392.1 hypothetical protein [Actinomyces sp. AC-20-1]MCL3789086.1 hypothetical protein [Actinomyces sp. 187325]MCL3791660.1 hypothetical protein [Actinomyces sp. 186855]MCL3793888.1 hypothetical protein [Actinomyces sp. 217892]